MSNVANIQIETCEQCPHHVASEVYTDDSWDQVRKIHCKKLNKDVYSYLDWHEESPVPDECPFNQSI